MAQRAIEWSEQLTAAVSVGAPAVLRLVRHPHGASATVWDAAAGLVVTSHHAIGGEDVVRVVVPGSRDGHEREAQVVGRDPGTDLALLKMDPDGLVGLTFREVDEVAVGTPVLALARPGTGIRASFRIIGLTADGVRTPWGGRLEHYLETDRGLPRGFSGGPLIDLEGSAIGINTSGLIRGADLAVPTVTVRRVLGELARSGAVKRGYLGVAVQRVRLPGELAARLSQKSGALVVAVDEGSPAASAGLVLGDVVVTLDGQAVGGPDGLRELLAERRGASVPLRIVRVGALEDRTVSVGEVG